MRIVFVIAGVSLIAIGVYLVALLRSDPCRHNNYTCSLIDESLIILTLVFFLAGVVVLRRGARPTNRTETTIQNN